MGNLYTLNDLFKTKYGPLFQGKNWWETPEARRARILKKWNLRTIHRYLGVKND